jgi:hypothetical protein
MATREAIKAAILKAAGNPESGGLLEVIDVMVEQVYAIDNPPSATRVEEKVTRVIKPSETR